MLPYRFTGKELDRETGLYYYGARYLDPKRSRWLSSDPAGFELINPMEKDDEGKLVPKQDYSMIEGLNWYSYVSNNPVKYVDPNGMNEEEADSTKKATEIVDQNKGSIIKIDDSSAIYIRDSTFIESLLGGTEASIIDTETGEVKEKLEMVTGTPPTLMLPGPPGKKLLTATPKALL